MSTTFLNPYTDFGFKKIFGEEASKPLLMDFLNSLLPEHHQIADLEFRNTEQLGLREYDRKAFYDLYCQSTTGVEFIVELQKTAQTFFIDRTVYYSTFPIQKQAPKGRWDYQLDAVYCISILDFDFHYPKVKDDESFEEINSTHIANPEVIHIGKIRNQHNRIIFDKLTYIYLEMPAFNKTENELNDQLDKWLYFIKNLENFSDIPHIFKNTLFEQAFATAYISNMSDEELIRYQRSLKTMWDDYATHQTSYQDGYGEGRQEGIEEGLQLGVIKTAKGMKQNGIDNSVIMQITGLTIEQINQL